MIIKKLEDIVGTKGEAHGPKWHSLWLLHEEDGMGVTLADSILEAGFTIVLWRKNHLEACYCLEGEGTVEDLATGTIHEIRAGTIYAMNNHDRHRLHAKTRMRVICSFVPALTGRETHDEDGSLRGSIDRRESDRAEPSRWGDP
jgi:L-ectoine synthase